ncbi:MAG TPA: hypothetical protein VGB88_00775 [Alphaproteobacteria bacterium]
MAAFLFFGARTGRGLAGDGRSGPGSTAEVPVRGRSSEIEAGTRRIAPARIWLFLRRNHILVQCNRGVQA